MPTEPPILEGFGDRLRAERERLGLNQTAMAQLGGVQRPAQNRYETGQRVPDAAYLARIASAGIDLNRLLLGTPSQEPTSTGKR